MVQKRRLKFFAFLSLPFLSSLLLPGCMNSGPDPMNAEEAWKRVLIGMMQRGEEWDAVKKKLFFPASPRLFNEKDSTLYFVLPDSLCGPGRNRLMARYVVDTNRLKWNWRRKGILVVGILRARISPESGCACRAKLNDIRIDTAAKLVFPTGKRDYQLSIAELAEWLDDRHIYGGAIEGGEALLSVNHGLRVAAPGEPTLGRLVGNILSGIPDGEEHREKRIQALLDFVTGEITYDSSLLYRGKGIHRRPNEIIMMGKGDKTNQVILFASLLEQIDEDYLIAYSGKGIFLALPRGEFPNSNGHGFEWEGDEWTLCETQIPGFRIGNDRSRSLPVFADIFQVQRPRQLGITVNPHTGKVFKMF